jgi:hypothetical protein
VIKIFDVFSAFCAINLFSWLFVGISLTPISFTETGIWDSRTFFAFIAQGAALFIQTTRQLDSKDKPFDWRSKK